MSICMTAMNLKEIGTQLEILHLHVQVLDSVLIV